MRIAIHDPGLFSAHGVLSSQKNGNSRNVRSVSDNKRTCLIRRIRQSAKPALSWLLIANPLGVDSSTRIEVKRFLVVTSFLLQCYSGSRSNQIASHDELVHLWIISGSSLIFAPQFLQYSTEVFSTQTGPKHHAAFLAVNDVCVLWHHEFTLKRSENPYPMRRHVFRSGKKNAQRSSMRAEEIFRAE